MDDEEQEHSDALAIAEEELDELDTKFIIFQSRVDDLALSIGRLEDDAPVQERERLQNLLRDTKEKLGAVIQRIEYAKGRADELGKQYREQVELKVKKPKIKM